MSRRLWQCKKSIHIIIDLEFVAALIRDGDSNACPYNVYLSGRHEPVSLPTEEADLLVEAWADYRAQSGLGVCYD